MKRLYKLVAQVLIVTMVWMPFTAQAGMIGTDQLVAGAQDQSNRDKVINFMSRGDVVKQFEALGLSASTAKQRVEAMTQEEVGRLAGKIDSLPTGADNSGIWIASLLIVGIVIWLVWFR